MCIILPYVLPYAALCSLCSTNKNGNNSSMQINEVHLSQMFRVFELKFFWYLINSTKKTCEVTRAFSSKYWMIFPPLNKYNRCQIPSFKKQNTKKTICAYYIPVPVYIHISLHFYCYEIMQFWKLNNRANFVEMYPVCV